MKSSSQAAIHQAAQALKRGDKRAVRYWAEQALADNPSQEEAWLLLAAVSTPRASLEYLQRALQINPQSERAKQGLDWARKRLEQPLPVNKSQTCSLSVDESPVKPAPTRTRTFSFGVSLLVLGVIVFLIFGKVTPARGFFYRLRYPPQPTPQSITVRSIDTVPSTEPVSAPPATRMADVSAPFSAQPTATLWPTPLPTDTPDPQQPAPNFASGKQIVVDISEQRMYVYENGTLIYNFVVSTGMNGGTRVGTFSVLEKIPNAYGSTWNIWMPNWLGIYWSGHLQNGIHALPILPNGQRLWAGYLGTPVSYGCVVLGTYESELLYNWAEVGTPVIIQY
ncbi:MAG: hypothetical protein DDG60_01365 [Anaerolineae bacterium]|nr:MAG: hypothetical protein DDG60_01365 [Anaerolineae bacterium]